MPDVFVAKAAEFADGDRRIVAHDGVEIGVFNWQGHLYAYENLCIHQGGPACEGVIMHKVEDVLPPALGRAPASRRPRRISSARGTATNTTSQPANARRTGGSSSNHSRWYGAARTSMSSPEAATLRRAQDFIASLGEGRALSDAD